MINRRQIWATVFTLPALCVLLALGTWQTQRLAWKDALILQRGKALQKPPIEMSGKSLQGNAEALHYRWVLAEGRFVNNAPVFIGPRTRNGQAGFHVLALFQLSDGTHLLVNRGFVPSQGADPIAWKDQLPSGTTQISGILRRPGKQAWLIPDNSEATRRFYWYDMAALGRVFGVSLAPVVFDLYKPLPSGKFPVAGQTRIDSPNNHLQYAVTWFAFACVLLIIYVIFMLRERSAKGGNTS